MNMRDRLFHAIYFRAAAAYAELVPRLVLRIMSHLSVLLNLYSL